MLTHVPSHAGVQRSCARTHARTHARSHCSSRTGTQRTSARLHTHWMCSCRFLQAEFKTTHVHTHTHVTFPATDDSSGGKEGRAGIGKILGQGLSLKLSFRNLPSLSCLWCPREEPRKKRWLIFSALRSSKGSVHVSMYECVGV